MGRLHILPAPEEASAAAPDFVSPWLMIVSVVGAVSLPSW